MAVPQPTFCREGVFDRSSQDESLRPGRGLLRQSVRCVERTEWIGGAAFPLNRRVELEGYFDYQHDTGGDHNRRVHAIGTVLNLYF